MVSSRSLPNVESEAVHQSYRSLISELTNEITLSKWKLITSSMGHWLLLISEPSIQPLS